MILNFLEKYPDLPRIFISFEDTINNSVKESKKIANFLGIKLTKKKIKKIKKFVILRNKIRLKKGVDRVFR